LESYHPYLLPQEVSKTPTTLSTYSSLPKIRKGRFGSLRPLGVNIKYFAILLDTLPLIQIMMTVTFEYGTYKFFSRLQELKNKKIGSLGHKSYKKKSIKMRGGGRGRGRVREGDF
jgi:hypothetical protein